ncbi:GIY-YIG nuclease family protein [Phenylobacterium kunshanense]|uniref:Bacteriophage T5 Orf172 DNA-binding domain-containing protein n=1 Tax=Phenylobacterium kunshanense TaxID=1445034 RepID=A0A328BP17_9CAUL|nr:GIY-YIG nuclease family protein [Phenylobacterium kunshanense]RAK68843.1 hypothetical protein DJ019_02170 [Phenylobacterium kunshanense]
MDSMTYETTEKPAGFVYFISAEGAKAVKIGSAKSPRTRLRELQTGAMHDLVLLAVIPHPRPRKLEQHLHAEFGEHRIRSEWFSYTSEIEAFLIESAFDAHGNRVWTAYSDDPPPDIEGAWDWI